MQSNNYLLSKMHLLSVFGFALILASCGTYQYAGQEDDAIYSDSERYVEYSEEPVQETTSDDSGYFKNYFKEKSLQYDNLSQDDVIFTDIDSYGSYDEGGQNDNYQDGYAGWGAENDNVTVNIYGGHYFNSIRWNRPFYTSWGWNYGYGFGYGLNFYDPFWCPPYYGGFFAFRPWWSVGFYNGYGYGYGFNNFGYSYYGNYGRRALAYNASRRNPAYSNSNLASLGRRDNSNSTLRTRPTTTQRGRPASTYRTRPTTTQRGRPASTYRTRPTTTQRGRPTTTQRGRPTTTQRGRPTTTTRTRPTSTKRDNKTTRRNNTSSNRSRSSNRSSGFSRSSSSSRSSGTRSSSGRTGSSRRGGTL